MSGVLAEDVRALYQDVILRHSRAPLHAHRIDPHDAAASGDNPMCGDRVEVFVRRDADGRFADIGYEAHGCAISLASADLMADLLVGRTRQDAARIAGALAVMVRTGTSDMADMERLRPLAEVHAYPSRRRCAMLPWQALMAALGMAEPGEGA